MTKIKELREGKGLSIAAICYETRVHPSTLSLVERKKAHASGRVRRIVSKYLGISETEAFDSDGLAV